MLQWADPRRAELRAQMSPGHNVQSQIFSFPKPGAGRAQLCPVFLLEPLQPLVFLHADTGLDPVILM